MNTGKPSTVHISAEEVKYSTRLSRESAEEVKYSTRLSRESAEEVKYSTRLSRESAEDCRLKCMLQQTNSRAKPSTVHVSAENQPSAVHVSVDDKQKKAKSHAHLNYVATEARNVLSIFVRRTVIRNTYRLKTSDETRNVPVPRPQLTDDKTAIQN